ncbi:nuclear transport factor 2 family protein [Roseateles sp. PN1]|uniref:nuclear transport factor 2 family protein n=1 Tax=Roseateles sp. PN1 TaxID=3137372 RepID=UPI003138FA87
MSRTTMMRTAEELAQAQLLAYNAKDLDSFVACYSEDVRVWRLASGAAMPPLPLQPQLQGRAAFRELYRQGPFAAPQVQAEVTQRIVMGDTVIDHERVHGRGEGVQQVAVVYRCREGLIAEVYFFLP